MITSTPQLKKSLHISLVNPTPCAAAFSPFTITKSIFFLSISFNKLLVNLEHPEIPTTSPKNKFDEKKINKLNAIYPNTTNYVLRGLNLNMNRGDRLALVGRSGCGKSTVAKAVMQLLPAGCICKGEIFLNGKNVLKLRV